MTNDVLSLIQNIQDDFSGHAVLDMAALVDEQELKGRLVSVIARKTLGVSEELRKRVDNEFFALGPLEKILLDTKITEIIVNGLESIWIEVEGRLHLFEDTFATPTTFRNAIQRLCRQSESQLTLDHPYVSGKWENFRLQIIGPPLAKDYVVSLRRHPKNAWSFGRLSQAGWLATNQEKVLANLIEKRANFLVVGPTGAGKTSVLDACLQQLPPNERVVIMEDTDELHEPNTSSTKLLTRIDPHDLLPAVDLSALLRHSLRLRPDRIVLGEVRGPEAKDLLLSLATGHSGSLGTLHATSAQEALLRLEMLVQLGAPQWSQSTVRRLIQLSLHYVVVAQKARDGKRFLEGVYKLTSLEEFGFLVERIA